MDTTTLKLTDNSNSTTEALAIFIAETASEMGLVAPRLLDQLEYGRRTGSWGIEFITQTGVYEKGNQPRYCEVTLYVRTERVWDADGMTSRVVDAAGDVYSRARVECKVNWAALGSTSPYFTARYAQLINSVAMLAEQIEAAFHWPVHTLLATKGRLDSTAVARAFATLGTAITNALDHAPAPKQMRVGTIRWDGPAILLPAGRYMTKRGEKEFQVDVPCTSPCCDAGSATTWRRIA